MTVPLAVLRIEELHEYGIVRECGHGEGCYELLGRSRHDNLDLSPLLDEQTCKVSRLVSGYASRNAQKYVLALEHDYCWSSTLR